MLKVVGQDPNGFHFRIKMTPEMGKSKKPNSERLGVSVPPIRYLVNGQKMNTDAPKQVINSKFIEQDGLCIKIVFPMSIKMKTRKLPNWPFLGTI